MVVVFGDDLARVHRMHASVDGGESVLSCRVDAGGADQSALSNNTWATMLRGDQRGVRWIAGLGGGAGTCGRTEAREGGAVGVSGDGRSRRRRGEGQRARAVV